MRLAFYIFIVLIMAVLSHSNFTGGVIDYALVFLWLFTWIGSKDRALTYAIGLGLVFDLVSFLPFGFWVLTNILIINVIDYLKTNYLTVSSFFQAMAVLVVATALLHTLLSILVGEFNYLEIGYSISANAILGGMSYYLVATKLKMIQRWSGRVL